MEKKNFFLIFCFPSLFSSKIFVQFAYTTMTVEYA